MPPDACVRPCGLVLGGTLTPARCAGYSVCTCRRPLPIPFQRPTADTPRENVPGGVPSAYRRLAEDEAAPTPPIEAYTAPS
ncbi:hypothetical protein CCHR01_11355 [Colletotrichum chrysophilum]|uniref:Uncharacterized protein n=1 Tax=Colletotrichum chrysophilum TaxID=1836956 RepID=A0AAD9AI32_9PEZI|nr:hypothetical protein CCHR01_11355 [Colletotrichum chrysophilum]